MAIVYVHAFTNDSEIENNLARIYDKINNKKYNINGLMKLRPIATRRTLDNLLEGQPLDFKEKINGYFPSGDLTGLGIWSEWSDEKYIDEFYKSNLHKRFIGYAINTLDKAWYAVAQNIDGKVKLREIKRPTK